MGVRQGSLRQHQHKLFPAITSQAVRRPQLADHQPGGMHQGRISRLVAVLVINGLEMIQVQQGAGQGVSMAVKDRHAGRHPLHQRPAVQGPRQSISRGQTFDLGQQLGHHHAPVGNIGDHLHRDIAPQERGVTVISLEGLGPLVPIHGQRHPPEGEQQPRQ